MSQLGDCATRSFCSRFLLSTIRQFRVKTNKFATFGLPEKIKTLFFPWENVWVLYIQLQDLSTVFVLSLRNLHFYNDQIVLLQLVCLTSFIFYEVVILRKLLYCR